ncbi:MFS transporter [Roseisalinus antarcticus]
MSMGFQFQAVPALAAQLTADRALSFAALGSLAGAYLLPGVVAALGSGWLGQRLGDIRTALWGLGMMTLAGVCGWLAESFGAALLWRVVAGCGAVGLNVMLTKMAADWFQDRDDLPTAMGVLVSSWPAGIALAMVVVPPVALWMGLGVAMILPAVVAGAALGLLALVWRAPPSRGGTVRTGSAGWLTRRELALVLIAGGIWALYNTSLIAVIAWTPGLLQARGVDAIAAAAAVSLIGWLAILSVAAGGWLAARSPWRDLPALACFGLSIAGYLAIIASGAAAASPWAMAAMGLVFGPAAAVIMTLPVEASRPQVRALTMGLYLAVYYLFMGVGPPMLGALRDVTGSAAAPLHAGAAMLVGCLVLWAGFRGLQRRGPETALGS